MNHYHVCNPGLPPCFGHDGYEGFIPRDVWLAFKYFVKTKKWFKIAFLNYRIKHIKVNSLARVFVPKITFKKSKKLVGSSCQIRYLLLILPLAIADFIQDYNDQVWQMILSLRRICDVCTAPCLSLYQIESLRDEIHNYIHKRKMLFPTDQLQPKHLFLTHYPDLTLHFGPLKHLWTLRFESAHQYFKNVIRHSQNFKNVTRVLSEKHELLHSLNKNTYDDTVQLVDSCTYDIQKYEREITTLIDTIIISFVCKTIIYRGITYSINMTLCVEGEPDYGDYIICTIKYILVDADAKNVWFIGCTGEIEYHTASGVYENVCEQTNNHGKLRLFPYSYLLSAAPLPESEISLKKVYTPKYAPYAADY